MSPHPQAVKQPKGPGPAAAAAPSDSAMSTSMSTHTRMPVAPPPFTIGELRAAIPKHCFERSALTSFKYLFVDIAIMCVLFAAANHIDTVFSSSPYIVRAVAWVTYWVLQGCIMTGMWVVGHECGHQAFSSSTALNDTVGLIVHTYLLVPYFSWAISHRKHHSNTGNVERDEVFVPKHRDDIGDVDDTFRWSLPMRVIHITLTLTVGWFLYLAFNIAGRPYPKKNKWVNHFTTSSPIFLPKERKWVIVSDLALAVMVYGLYLVSNAYGFAFLFKMYLVPYFIVNFWLVLITLLQHTDVYVPHYSGESWDWLRGALATVDRDFGFLLNHCLNRIVDTHVAHHLFSTIPHYHAAEATEAIKPILGSYYRSDPTSWPVALWRAFRECHYVEEDPNAEHDGVLWFRRGGSTTTKTE
jgi:omega-6 fatty acid desaturase / acyl-lipid omega-6 desaturase (Delta-12 desaturase)